jgi:NitT/TauT family transport system permease protein
LLQLILLAAFLGGWEYFGRISPDYALAPPSSVFPAAREMIESGELQEAIFDSAEVLLIGFALAAVAGNALGFAMGWSRVLGRALDPFIAAFYVLPIIAFVPVIIVWVGIGSSAKILVVFLLAFFEIVINAQAGVRNVDPPMVDVARVFGAGRAQLVRHVLLPASLPFVFAGLRIGVVRAVKGMVLAEMLLAVTGLGALIIKYSASFQMDRVFVAILAIAAMGVALYGAVTALERRALRWR